MSYTSFVSPQKAIAPGYAPFWLAFIQVLRNTVGQGAPARSKIRVSTCVIGNRFVVTVEDDAPGADWGVTERSSPEIGVSTVRHACETLGGSVEINSREGEGTHISFAFPMQATSANSAA